MCSCRVYLSSIYFLSSRRRHATFDWDWSSDVCSSDLLTGLYNRRYVMEALANELRRSRRLEHPFTLLMLDVDHFKRSEEHTSELQSQSNLVCRLLLEKKKQ